MTPSSSNDPDVPNSSSFDQGITNNSQRKPSNEAPHQQQCRSARSSTTSIVHPAEPLTFDALESSVSSVAATKAAGQGAITACTTSTSTSSTGNGELALLFPIKLYNMLEDAHLHGFTDVCAWGQDSPQNFKVYNKRDFERVVLPKYFKMTKYKSFTRQLHNYEFTWIRTGNDKGGYCHPGFDRTNPSRIVEIRRNYSADPVLSDQWKRMVRTNAFPTTTPIRRIESGYEPLKEHQDEEEDHKPSSRESQKRMYQTNDDPLQEYTRQMSFFFYSRQQAPQQLTSPPYGVQSQQNPNVHRYAAAASNDPIHPDERKLIPSYLESAASPQSPNHPHPYDQILEPRTIEEMMECPHTGIEGSTPISTTGSPRKAGQQKRRRDDRDADDYSQVSEKKWK